MPFTVSDQERQELACVYAALALHDDKAAITGDNISKLITAAKIQGVEPYWPKLFASLLSGKNVGDMLTSGGGGAAAPAQAAAGGAAAPAAAKKEEKKKEEPKEEEEADMGFSLFD